MIEQLGERSWLVGCPEAGTATLVHPSPEHLLVGGALAMCEGLRIVNVVFNAKAALMERYARAFGAMLIHPGHSPQRSVVTAHVGHQLVRLKRFGSPTKEAIVYPVLEFDSNVVPIGVVFDVMTIKHGSTIIRLMGSRVGLESRLIGVCDGHVFTGGAMS